MPIPCPTSQLFPGVTCFSCATILLAKDVNRERGGFADIHEDSANEGCGGGGVSADEAKRVTVD